MRKYTVFFLGHCLILSACATAPTSVEQLDKSSPYHVQCEKYALEVAKEQTELENDSTKKAIGLPMAGVGFVGAMTGMGFGLNPGQILSVVIPSALATGGAIALFRGLDPNMQPVAEEAYKRCITEQEYKNSIKGTLSR